MYYFCLFLRSCFTKFPLPVDSSLKLCRSFIKTVTHISVCSHIRHIFIHVTLSCLISPFKIHENRDVCVCVCDVFVTKCT